MTDRIRVPPPPEAPERPTFPLLASVAPVVGALAMWAFTQSPYALLFAFLGPLVAIGGLIDSRRRHRRAARSARARFEVELTDTRARIEAALDAERRALRRLAANALDILTHSCPTHERWRIEPGERLMISLGSGDAPSSVTLDGTEHSGLAEYAATITDAPILCDARDGIGVIGTGPMSIALVRAIALQLAHAVSPRLGTLHVLSVQDALAPSELDWLHCLPHAAAPHAGTPPVQRRRSAHAHTVLRLTTAEGTRLATVALAEHETDLPRQCRVAVRVTGALATVVRWPDPDAAPTGLRPHLVARAAAARLARLLKHAADDDGLAESDDTPALVTLGDLGEQPPAAPGSLACVLGLDPGGAPVTVDLARDGPHALVGGTTGSGKSELLCAWILALTMTRSPRELTVLLIDYKGGASFRTVEGLPHVVGAVTDLDPVEARRALDSLTAELRHRERQLSERGARDIVELAPGTLPRLVIVVDEYAALVSEHEGLHGLFADISARGRSLGVHLILATQRPAGIVRDGILANTPLRVCLRVLDAADSVAVVGTRDAAHILGDRPGRAILVTPARAASPLQSALVTAQDAEAVRRADPADPAAPPRRPWQPPLPLVVTQRSLRDIASSRAGPETAGEGLRFALADRPTEQRRAVATLDLATTGNLLVLGARGSGRTTALDALADAADDSGLQTVRIPGDIEGAWDTIHDLLDDVRSPSAAPRLCLADDIDLVLSRTPDDYREALTRALASLLAEGPSRGIHLALTAARLGPATSALASACDARLVLRTADRHEHHTAGADPQHFTPHLPPGRGWYRGDLVHVVMPRTSVAAARTPAPAPRLPRGAQLIVTTRPAELVARLTRAWGSGSAVALGADAATISTASGESRGALVADPDSWGARLALFTELSRRMPVVYHDCSLAQFRLLSGRRTLPPPLAAPADTVWLTLAATTTTRATLPRVSAAAPRGDGVRSQRNDGFRMK